MAASNESLVSFESVHPSFSSILGANPTITLLAEDTIGTPLFHEACIYHKPSKSIFVTSNQISASPTREAIATANKTVRLFRIYDTADPATPAQKSKVEDVTPKSLELSMLNGGVNYGESAILLCAQGSKNPTQISGVVELPIPSANEQPAEASCRVLTSNFYGRPFNSVNDVIVHPDDGSIWFTDPCYGYYQSIRHNPQLPNQVYRFDPKDNSIRAMADGFTRCNGLCLSPDRKTMYVTDTGAVHGSPEVEVDPTGPSHIYAFDVSTSANGAVFLTNRRLFAFAEGKCPDGIKCDEDGNVYSGCWNGVAVWNSGGMPIGRILVQGGVANFCFGEKGVIYMCNETRLWKVQLSDTIRGALLGL